MARRPAKPPLARVLLSAYDSIEWRFSAADIVGLEPPDREAALTVLQGRAELGAPQDFGGPDNEDPAQLFRELWHLWRGPEQEAASS